MTRNPETGPVDVFPVHLPGSFNAVIRFLVIPVLVYVIWVLEIFLFGGGVHLFPAPTGPALVLYTLVACILMGPILPGRSHTQGIHLWCHHYVPVRFPVPDPDGFHSSSYLRCVVRCVLLSALPVLTRRHLCRVSSS